MRAQRKRPTEGRAAPLPGAASGVRAPHGLASWLQSPRTSVASNRDTHPKRRMIMIRNTMFALSLLALTSTSAFAASKVVAVHHSTRTLAEGEAAPAADKPAKEEKKSKKAKKEK